MFGNLRCETKFQKPRHVQNNLDLIFQSEKKRNLRKLRWWRSSRLLFWLKASTLSGQRASLVARMVKNLSAMWETWVGSWGWENSLEKRTATHSSALAWKTPWTEEPGRLQSIASQRVEHDWATNTLIFFLVITVLTQSPGWSLCHFSLPHSNPPSTLLPSWLLSKNIFLSLLKDFSGLRSQLLQPHFQSCPTPTYPPNTVTVSPTPCSFMAKHTAVLQNCL